MSEILDELQRASLFNPELRIVHAKVTECMNTFLLNNETLERFAAVFRNEMVQGLSADETERKRSSLQMEPTYVHKVCDGTETGEYLGLDLGGTNFRVLYLQLENGKQVRSACRYYNCTEAILTGRAEPLFDHIATSIRKFLEEEKLPFGMRYQLGFTFSFPMIQRGLRSGVLVTWTKTFRNTSGVGEDAVVHLERALRDAGIADSVHVSAILNDTTGTLMCGTFLDHECRVGAILGTGSNGCYIERVARVPRLSNEPLEAGDKVLIDIEWGAFGDNHSIDFLKTPFDAEVNRFSNHVDSFTFEKLFSGMYLGELVRLVLLSLIDSGALFDGRFKEQLSTRWSFTTDNVSEIERDQNEPVNTKRVLASFGIASESSEDYTAVRYVCACVSVRAALLISRATAVVLERVDDTRVTIAVDGSVFEHHPKLSTLLAFYTSKFAPSKLTRYIPAPDGSGRGAALVAAACDPRHAASN